MIELPHYQGRSLAILGLGKTGMAAARALIASGAHVVLWDDTEQGRSLAAQEFADCLLAPQSWDYTQLDALLLSPGIPLTHPRAHPVVLAAREAGVRITSDIELLYEACPDATFVGITGTNGKSTTTALIGHILKEAGRRVQVGGNIGEPVLALKPGGTDTIYVLELSSFQLDLLQAVHLNIALWLNISPDHLDRHGNMEGYIAAKKQIFAGQSSQDTAIIGVDDAYSEAVARELIAGGVQAVVPISVRQKAEHGLWVQDGVLHEAGDTLQLAQMPSLRGLHNHQNAAAAYGACRALGVSSAQIAGAMMNFAGLAHRMQQVRQIAGVLFVNDSKATNADAAARSLGSYEHIYWVAGGVAKDGGIQSLAAYFPRIRKAYLIGRSQEAFAQTLDGQLDYVLSDDLAAATNQAFADAKVAGGGVVLLAPACASFDQFANFERRGEAFVSAVEALR